MTSSYRTLFGDELSQETRYHATGRVAYDEYDQKPSKPIAEEIGRALAKY